MQAMRNDRITAVRGKTMSLKDATAFVFCVQELQVAQKSSRSIPERSAEKDGEKPVKAGSDLGLHLPAFNLANLALLLPSLVAAHGGLLSTPSGVATSCMPIMSPFQVPSVSPDSWMPNKRARAFHRSSILGVYLQGAICLQRLYFGDIVGGLFTGVQTAYGAYALTPSGVRSMPSYMMICGFNGVLGLVQVFQMSQGMSPLDIPVFAWAPPGISCIACYWGWQFARELKAIGAGSTGEGAQDTIYVNMMGSDSWLVKAIDRAAPGGLRAVREESATSNRTASEAAGAVARFTVFGGEGNQLGGADDE